MVEDSGFDGIGIVDTQNLAADPYSELCLAAHATKHLKLRTAVTNPVTRHPAVTASAIATVQAESGGRAVLGSVAVISAVAKIGERAPSSKDFARYISQVQGFLRGEEVTLDNGFRSRNEWIARAGLPKVPVDVAATGPRVIEVAATLADSVTFAVGADPERLAWPPTTPTGAPAGRLDPATLKLGAYLNWWSIAILPARVRCRAEPSARSPTSRECPAIRRRGCVRTTARWRRKSARRTTCPDTRAETPVTPSSSTTPSSIGLPSAGPPAHCVSRFEELLKLSLDHLIVVGPGADVGPSDQLQALGLFTKEVLPVLKSGRQTV